MTRLYRIPDRTFPFDAVPRRPLLNWGALAWMVAVVAFWAVVAWIVCWWAGWA